MSNSTCGISLTTMRAECLGSEASCVLVRHEQVPTMILPPCFAGIKVARSLNTVIPRDGVANCSARSGSRNYEALRETVS